MEWRRGRKKNDEIYGWWKGKSCALVRSPSSSNDGGSSATAWHHITNLPIFLSWWMFVSKLITFSIRRKLLLDDSSSDYERRAWGITLMSFFYARSGVVWQLFDDCLSVIKSKVSLRRKMGRGERNMLDYFVGHFSKHFSLLSIFLRLKGNGFFSYHLNQFLVT